MPAAMEVTVRKFKTWAEARDFIRATVEDEDSHYRQTDFWSYKDGSGDATLTSNWDWARIYVEWGAS